MVNIIEYIPTGAENAVTQAELAAALHVDKRTVRQLIYTARQNGAVICSTPNNSDGGYYLPISPAEALPYVRFQQSRIKSAQSALGSAERYINKGGAKNG
ncbi:MAG: HTH domain-containing protein [Oscillospiraceae bacterium]